MSFVDLGVHQRTLNRPCVRLFKPSVVTISYVLAMFVSLFGSYLAITHTEKASLGLKQSTFFYSHKDLSSIELAALAKAQLHIQTLDLLSPGAGEIVYRLTGSHTAVSPSIVMRSRGGLETVSGPSAVMQVLQPVTSPTAPAQQGKLALLVMASLILVALALEIEISKIVAFLPILGLVAVGALWGHCLHCFSGGTPLSTFAPLLELAYLAAGLVLFTIPITQHRLAFNGFLFLSGLIPAVQAYMLSSEPKLCPACLAITFTSAAYFVATLRVLRTSEVTGVAVPLVMRILMVGALVLLLIRHSLVLGGYIGREKLGDQVVPSVIGSPMSKFLSGEGDPRPGLLYLVTLDGCHACEHAEHDLRYTNIRWQAVPVCTMLASTSCFDGGKLNFPTPMLLMCDAQGKIIFQHEGWYESATESGGLMSEIKTVQRRMTQTKR